MDEEAKFRRFVEVNVQEQVLDLAKTSILQSAWKDKQPLEIHGWVYDVKDGIVKDLGVTIENNTNLPDVYQLDID